MKIEKSGQNDEDILKSAYNDYKSEKGHPFAYMHILVVGFLLKKSKTSETNSSLVPFDLNLMFDDEFGDSQPSHALERNRKVIEKRECQHHLVQLFLHGSRVVSDGRRVGSSDEPCG